jgi:hypothetical protein
MEGDEVYYTHHNGGRPYKVVINGKNVTVYDRIYSKSLDNYAEILNCHLIADKVFIGKSPLIEMTNISGAHGSAFDGNSILIREANNNYKFIGHEIIEFKPDNDIIKTFVSPVGNNDVPYPFAIGKKYVYSFVHPFGYIDIKLINIENYDWTINDMSNYGPFFTNFDHTKKFDMTPQEFEIIRNKPLNEIPAATIKMMARMFSVTTSGSKQTLVDRILHLRNIRVCKTL